MDSLSSLRSPHWGFHSVDSHPHFVCLLRVLMPYRSFLNDRPLFHCLLFWFNEYTRSSCIYLFSFCIYSSSSVADFFRLFLGSEETTIMTTMCISFSLIFSMIAFFQPSSSYQQLGGLVKWLKALVF